jgi:hypothetical protein
MPPKFRPRVGDAPAASSVSPRTLVPESYRDLAPSGRHRPRGSPGAELARSSQANLAVVAAVLGLRFLVPLVCATVLLALRRDPDVEQQSRQMPPDRCPKSIPLAPAHHTIMDDATSEDPAPARRIEPGARSRKAGIGHPTDHSLQSEPLRRGSQLLRRLRRTRRAGPGQGRVTGRRR